MTEAHIPEQVSNLEFSEQELMIRVNATFETMLSEDDMSDDELLAAIGAQVNLGLLATSDKSDQPYVLLIAALRATGIMLSDDHPDRKNVYSLRKMTDADIAFEKAYDAHVKGILMETFEKQELFEQVLGRGMGAKTSDLYNYVDARFAETNLMRSFVSVRRSLPAGKYDAAVGATRLAMLMLTPREKVEEIVRYSE